MSEQQNSNQLNIELTEEVEDPRGPRADILAIHEALEKLEAVDSEKARIIELRYFGGLSVLETATVLGVSESTIHRQWRLARACWGHGYAPEAARAAVADGFERVGLDEIVSMTAVVNQNRPESRGSIHIRTAEAADAPDIHANYLR